MPAIDSPKFRDDDVRVQLALRQLELTLPPTKKSQRQDRCARDDKIGSRR